MTPDQRLLTDIHAHSVTMQDQLEALADGVAALYAHFVTGERPITSPRMIAKGLDNAGYVDDTWVKHLEDSIRQLLEEN
jgi:hypothetical protein